MNWWGRPKLLLSSEDSKVIVVVRHGLQIRAIGDVYQGYDLANGSTDKNLPILGS